MTLKARIRESGTNRLASILKKVNSKTYFWIALSNVKRMLYAAKLIVKTLNLINSGGSRFQDKCSLSRYVQAKKILSSCLRNSSERNKLSNCWCRRRMMRLKRLLTLMSKLMQQMIFIVNTKRLTLNNTGFRELWMTQLKISSPCQRAIRAARINPLSMRVASSSELIWALKLVRIRIISLII